MVSEEKLEQYREDALRDRVEEEQQALCTHVNAYVQEFRATVHMKEGNHAGQKTIVSVTGGKAHTSDMFDLEAEHYCPDCGKTRWAHFDLEDDMFTERMGLQVSVTGESGEALED
jgi:hypothetical protein